MLQGFNTNVHHQGVLFHVQTEDSGRAHPHVITHLYHGGTILASQKNSYAEIIEEPDLDDRLRERMEQQHVAMLDRLRGGELDEMIAERLGPDAFQAGEKSSPGQSAGNTQRAVLEPEGRPVPDATVEITARSGARQPLDELVLDFLVQSARAKRRAQ
ncbi:MAG: hypothetical protein QNK03_10375 [Myxococcota bacterium]|nr:hypothetical protein [Myxococcota bacterium]